MMLSSIITLLFCLIVALGVAVIVLWMRISYWAGFSEGLFDTVQKVYALRTTGSSADESNEELWEAFENGFAQGFTSGRDKGVEDGMPESSEEGKTSCIVCGVGDGMGCCCYECSNPMNECDCLLRNYE